MDLVVLIALLEARARHAFALLRLEPDDERVGLALASIRFEIDGYLCDLYASALSQLIWFENETDRSRFLHALRLGGRYLETVTHSCRPEDGKGSVALFRRQVEIAEHQLDDWLIRLTFCLRPDLARRVLQCGKFSFECSQP